MKQFSEYLKQHRAKAGLTMRGLADKLGISVSFISDMEKGNRLPSAWLAEAITKAFGMSEAEAVHMYDLLAEEKGGVPDDIIRMLLANKERYGEIREYLRRKKEAAK
jgi:transcriptional regulator with XRE-family HTH domain